MRSGINRQYSKRQPPTAQAVQEYRATLLRLSTMFPPHTEGEPSAVRDYLNSHRRPGRRHVLPPAGFWQMRDQAIADLCAEIPPRRPTQANIAKRLGIGVRTLYNCEHRPAGDDDSSVRLTINGPGFKIESGG